MTRDEVKVSLIKVSQELEEILKDGDLIVAESRELAQANRLIISMSAGMSGRKALHDRVKKEGDQNETG